ncbi:hypothetical protein GN956_G26061, partial [Arapaima gigas]
MECYKSQDFEDELESSVVIPFTEALMTLSSLSEAVDKIRMDAVEASERELVTELIQTARKYTSAAEKSALMLQEKVGNESAQLLCEQRKQNEEIESKKQDLKDLQRKCETMEGERNTLLNKKAEHEKELQETKEKIAKAQEEQKRANETFETSLWWMLVPVVGTIAGGISAIVSAVQYNNAVAEEKTQTEMAKYMTNKINGLEKDLDAIKKQIQEKHKDIE